MGCLSSDTSDTFTAQFQSMHCPANPWKRLGQELQEYPEVRLDTSSSTSSNILSYNRIVNRKTSNWQGGPAEAGDGGDGGAVPGGGGAARGAGREAAGSHAAAAAPDGGHAGLLHFFACFEYVIFNFLNFLLFLFPEMTFFGKQTSLLPMLSTSAHFCR